MADPRLEETLAGIQEELARLNRKVDYLHKQATLGQRRWETAEDLGKDLALVGQSAFAGALSELQDLDPTVTAEDSARLARRVLENARNLEWALQQLEALRDLVRDAGPILTEVFSALTAGLERLDRRGAFEVLEELKGISDAMLEAGDRGDQKQMRAGVGDLVGLMRQMSRAPVLRLLRRVGEVLQGAQEGGEERPVRGLWSLARRLREPEVRRGVELLLRVVRALPDPKPAGRCRPAAGQWWQRRRPGPRGWIAGPG